MQILKDLPLNGVLKKNHNVKVFVKSENMSTTSLEYVQMLDLLNNPTKLQLYWIRTLKLSVKTIQKCCGLEIWSRSLKVV